MSKPSFFAKAKMNLKRKKGNDQLKDRPGADGFAAGVSSQATSVEIERGEAGDEEKEKEKETAVYSMKMYEYRKDEAVGRSLPVENPSIDTSDSSLLNNTTSQGAGAADPYSHPRGRHSLDNPDNSRSTRGNGEPKAGNEFATGNGGAHIAEIHNLKPATYITSNTQEIPVLEDTEGASSEGAESAGSNSTDTEREEDDKEALLQIVISSPPYKTLQKEYAALQREKQAWERKYTDLDATHVFSKRECTRLTAENSRLAQDKHTLQSDIQPLKERDGKLSTENQKLVNANAQLIHERDTWKAQHASLNDAHEREKIKATELNAALEAKQKELEQWQSLNVALSESKAEVERRNNELKSHLHASSGQLKAAQDENQRATKKNKQLSAQLAGYQFEGSVYTADSIFRQEWENLDSRIVNWSHHNFKGNSQTIFAIWPSKKPQKLKESHLFHRLAADPKRYLTSAERRPLFVQSFVWSILVDQVFTPPGGGGTSEFCGLYWSGPMREELDIISGYLYPDPAAKKNEKVSDEEIRKYMKWKAATTQLVLEKSNKDSDRDSIVYDEWIAGLQDIILSVLEPFITSTDYESCLKYLGIILRSAIKLDGKMNQQLAQLAPRYTLAGSKTNHLHGFQFDPDIMKLPQGEPDLGPEAKVQMVLTPALVRHGTIEGEKYENFEKPDVLVHAVVHLQSSYGFSRARVTKQPPDSWGEGPSRNDEHSSGRREIGRGRR